MKSARDWSAQWNQAELRIDEDHVQFLKAVQRDALLAALRVMPGTVIDGRQAIIDLMERACSA